VSTRKFYRMNLLKTLMKKEKTEITNEGENPKAKYTLDELLEGVNENNLLGEVDFGEPVGKEIID